LRILYLSQSYVPSRVANAVHVMNMCHAIGERRHDVTLVTKANAGRQEASDLNDFDFYGLQANFEIVKLPCPARRGGYATYVTHMARLLVRLRGKFDLLHCRDPWGAWLGSELGYPLILELHDAPSRFTERLLLRRTLRSSALVRVVFNCHSLRRNIEQDYRVPAGRGMVAHNGARPQDCTITASTDWDPGTKGDGLNLGYVGNLYPGKGMEVVVALAERLPNHRFEVVGGSARDLLRWRQGSLPGNVMLHGFVPPESLPDRLARLDVLLLPNQREVYGSSGRADFGQWTSPIKMFEYMASGKPIVASDLPVIREVLRDEENALLVPPDRVESWARAVVRLYKDSGLRKRLGEQARREQLDSYTWAARASAILNGIESEDAETLASSSATGV